MRICRWLLLPLLTLLLLTSCTPLGKAEVGKVTDFWTAADVFTAEMTLRAELSDRSVEFRMDCGYCGGVCTVRLLAPGELSGITVQVDRSGVTLGCEETMLTVGEETDLSPATAFAVLVHVWKNAGISAYGRETCEGRPCLLLCAEEGDREYRTLFDEETCLPVCAEIYTGGRRSYVCTFADPAAESAAPEGR